ncbi:MAG TPA: hypothetical protein VOB72_20590 [Candidatus Dormibacteraeota bacterium]|nr:hypothetical protein [Candidatus Dormibacteraeota bacterium]
MPHARALVCRLALVAVLAATLTVASAQAGRVQPILAAASAAVPTGASMPVYRYWVPGTQHWDSYPAGGDQPTPSALIQQGDSQFQTPQFYVDLVGNPGMKAVYRWWQPTDQDWVDIVEGDPSDATLTGWGYQQRTFQYYAWVASPPAGTVAVSRWWQPTTHDWMTVASDEISDQDMGAAGYTSKTYLFNAWPASSHTGDSGYFPLGHVSHAIITDPNEDPHTLSVLDVNPGRDPSVNQGYRFLGYYGHVLCAGIGIARSNDLVTWVQDPSMLFSGQGQRWASALADGNKIDMVYNVNYCSNPNNYTIVGRTSTDSSGTSFGDQTTLVAEPDHHNGNPFLFSDPDSKRIYLYWFRLGGTADRPMWEIRVKSAATFGDLLATGSSDIGTLLAQAPVTVAAPNLIYLNGTYYLTVETQESGVWHTRVMIGASPTGPFTEAQGNPLYLSGSACVTQYVIDGLLHSFSCHQDAPSNITTNWTLDEITAPVPTTTSAVAPAAGTARHR